MAHATDWSRYHPAVIPLSALATGCIAYALYASYAAKPTTALHRSNAVHRPRRDRQLLVIEHRNSTPDSPLGTMLIRRDDHFIEFNLANCCSRFLSEHFSEAHQYLSQQTEVFRQTFGNVAMEMVLSACSSATQNADCWSQLESIGFGDLLRAMSVHDEDQVRLHSHGIRDVLGVGDISDDQVQQAVEKFLGSDKWRGGSSDSEAADPAETEEIDMLSAANREPSQGLRGLLYYIAEEDAKRKAYEHRGIHCEECGEMPIRGVRWHCLNCPDYDLCSSCEAHTAHTNTHVFAKIRIPVPILSQPVQEYKLWYPGDPRKIHGLLDASLKRRLCKDHGFEDPQLDALYDQFVCLANVPWPADPSSVKAAIDRRAFDKALTSTKWPQRFSANSMYDRMFGFYDTDGNGIIDFPEFVSGMAYLRGPNRFASLQRAIRGFDMDGDGYVDRADFLRLLRAKFDIQKQLVSDMVDGQAPQITQGAMERLRSSQPISSLFSDEEIPPGEVRWPRGKQEDAFGDLQPLEGINSFLNDEDPWPRDRLKRQPAHERLRHHLSRFEELLFSPSDQSTASNAMDQLDGLGDPSDRVDEESPGQEFSFMEMVTRTPVRDDPSIDEPYVRDLLWQLTEAGLNELLDKLFIQRERQDYEATMTQRERQRWRKQIDEEVERSRKLGDLRLPIRPLSSESDDSSSPAFTDGVVPTDWESLERREKEIPDAPLEQLLHASGYGVRNDENATYDSSSPRSLDAASPSAQTASRPQTARSRSTRATITSPLRNSVSADEPWEEAADPTLPQHKPNAEPAAGIQAPQEPNRTSARPNSATMAFTAALERPPSPQRLEYLASMEKVHREVEYRGGPGRLSYDEIESVTTLESRGELRGLIKTWLEWATF
ncbi:E3 ubiquitin- ligase [Lecanosticta acicola]|uniref:E3 ubiquitin- ligase n=1 Tax=Lecanosticta acicola TaxID=111012 RepID=A0AAI8Z374_9PEZI|nr:E3 ubiquitin- ligase [Lecanosticta acicola]